MYHYVTIEHSFRYVSFEIFLMSTEIEANIIGRFVKNSNYGFEV